MRNPLFSVNRTFFRAFFSWLERVKFERQFCLSGFPRQESDEHRQQNRLKSIFTVWTVEPPCRVGNILLYIERFLVGDLSNSISVQLITVRRNHWHVRASTKFQMHFSSCALSKRVETETFGWRFEQPFDYVRERIILCLSATLMYFYI